MLPCDRRDCPGKGQRIALACKSLKPRLTEFSAVWAYNPYFAEICAFARLGPIKTVEGTVATRLAESGALDPRPSQ
jgi:hypothetical protein